MFGHRRARSAEKLGQSWERGEEKAFFAKPIPPGALFYATKPPLTDERRSLGV